MPYSPRAHRFTIASREISPSSFRDISPVSPVPASQNLARTVEVRVFATSISPCFCAKGEQEHTYKAKNGYTSNEFDLAFQYRCWGARLSNHNSPNEILFRRFYRSVLLQRLKLLHGEP